MSTTEEQNAQQNSPPAIPEPQVEDRHREQAARMAETYRDDRPATVLPGSDGMVSGTAVADWIDEPNEPASERTDAPPE
ncbi:hypothetical protein HLB23_35260 [Nocardia uniformis]|uniref:Uncharacterized protein n=1 Tax=Nocardia uniformis TaxID=53432 RepID=A0A849C8Y2_9NOCA|nr:hypothetical protein [Nocardia uniformis]NNH75052.1 hypothetical protein [Nocardia uniformis]